MTMAPYHGNTHQETWQVRTCCGCGKSITLLASQKSLALFYAEATMQRRGLRCMNCGEVTCYECRQNEGCCHCMSNAWVALPYLENTGTGAFPPPPST